MQGNKACYSNFWNADIIPLKISTFQLCIKISFLF